MRIAGRTGKSVSEAKAATPATEFWRWVKLFEQEQTERKIDHWYYALIASELSCIPYLVWGKQPPPAFRDIKNHLLKFGDPEEMDRKSEEYQEERAKQDAFFSRSVWLGALGLDEEGNQVGELKVRRPPDMPEETWRAVQARMGINPDATPNAPESPTSPDSAPGWAPPRIQPKPPQNANKRKFRVTVRGG